MSNEDSTNSSKHETDHGVAETLGRKPTGDEDLNQEGLKQDDAKQNKPETAPTNV